MATSFAVDLVFKSQGGRQIRDLSNQLQGLEGNSRKAQRSITGTGNAAATAGGKAAAAARGFGALRTAFTGLAVGAFVKTIVSASAEIERTQKRLETLTGSANNARVVFAQLQEINKKSPFQLTDLADTAAKLSAFGIQLDQVVVTTERLGKLSAATGQDINGIALAYGQVAAKGRLQTEELLQFQERGIPLQKELAKQLKVTEGELADLITKGKVGFPEVEKAVKNLTGETGKFGKAFENTADTIDAKLSNLQDAFKMAAGALGNAFAPVFKWMIEQLTNILNLIATAVNRWQGVQSLSKERVAQLRTQAGKDADKKFPGFNPFSSAKGDFFNKQLNTYIDNEINKKTGFTGKLDLSKVEAPTPGGAPTPTGTKSGGGGKSKQDNSAAELAALGQSVALKERLFQLDKQIQAAEIAKNDDLKFTLEFEKQIEETAGRIAEIRASDASAATKALQVREAELEGLGALADLTAQRQQKEADRQSTLQELQKGIADEIVMLGAANEQERQRLEFEAKIAQLKKDGVIKTQEEEQALRAANAELQKKKDLAAQIKQQQADLQGLYDGIGSTIANGIGSAIDAVASGTEDLGKTLQKLGQQILAQVGKMLIFYALAQAFGALAPGGKGIFGALAKGFGFTPRAEGGPVEGGKSYLVGENGPEILNMSPDGSGGYVYNNRQTSKAMARYRPGSNSTAAGGAIGGEAADGEGGNDINVSYTVERINERNYVTEEQFRQGMNQAAKRGAQGGYAKTMGSLRNSRSSRARVGL